MSLKDLLARDQIAEKLFVIVDCKGGVLSIGEGRPVLTEWERKEGCNVVVYVLEKSK